MIREVIEQKTQTSMPPIQRNDTVQPFRPQLPPSQFHMHQPGKYHPVGHTGGAEQTGIIYLHAFC